MIYEVNYALMVMIGLVILWPVVFITLLIYDFIKGNKFNPAYRATWPFMLFAEVFS